MEHDYIPRFSRDAWKKALENHRQELHPGLALFRFFDEKKEKKKLVLDRIAGIRFPTECKQLLERQKNHLLSLNDMGYSICQWQQTTATRLVCGLGIPSLAENGLFMDRVFGLPYLSGSALKGIAQDQALAMQDILTEQDSRRAWKRTDELFIAVFGAQSAEHDEVLDTYWESRKGHIFFLDAFPVLHQGSSPFDVDILNPHYDDYYKDQGKTPPADYLSPNPNFFLTVKKGVSFSFAVAAKNADFTFKDNNNKDQEVCVDANKLCDHAVELVQRALVWPGIGGKTRVDYGYFFEPA